MVDGEAADDEDDDDDNDINSKHTIVKWLRS